MLLAADYVKNHPSCVMRDCAHFVNPHPQPSRCEKYGYSIVWRAVKAGLIDARVNPKRRGSYVLFPIN